MLSGRITPLLIAAAGLAACSSDPPPPGGGEDAGALDTPDGGGGNPEAGSGARLQGTVTDRAGGPVGMAKIEVGTTSAFSDPQGKYTLALPMGGALTVKASRPWFNPVEASVTVAASGPTQHDLTLEEIPLKLDPADAALAESYASTFDWTRSTISIAVAPRPTRRDFDNAVFFRNPALYKDTSMMPMVTPAALPEIGASGPRNFTFPLPGGASPAVEALDLASIVDALPGTGLAAGDLAGFMIWTPMLTWLREWDTAKAAELNTVGVAVRQQTWGGNVPRPQEIDRVYLDTATGTMWVEVVFAAFVQLGPGITDNDGDGRREIYAKVAAGKVASDVIDKLTGEYGKTLFSTYGLSKEVAKSLNELYSSTAAQLERTIGQAFEVPGIGTVNYPFVVLRHIGGQKNAILVGPAP
jgi:hypothetical protein